MTKSRKQTNREYYLKNKERISRRDKEYYLKNKERIRRRENNLREKALEIVGRGKLECINCGCNKIKILEINHKNGGGSEEVKKYYKGRYTFYSAIISGKRSIEDVEILCKPCNQIHYVGFKFNVLGFKISWTTEVIPEIQIGQQNIIQI